MDELIHNSNGSLVSKNPFRIGALVRHEIGCEGEIVKVYEPPRVADLRVHWVIDGGTRLGGKTIDTKKLNCKIIEKYSE